MRRIAAETRLRGGEHAKGGRREIGRRRVPREERRSPARRACARPRSPRLPRRRRRNRPGRRAAASAASISAPVGQRSARKTRCRPAASRDRVGQDVAVDVAGKRVGDDRAAARPGNPASICGCTRPGKLRLPGQHRDRQRCRAARAPRCIGGRERAGIADAGRAAVADDAEAERLEIVEEAGAGQVALGGRRARREGGLHPGRAA